jgi:hypothetical protein
MARTSRSWAGRRASRLRRRRHRGPSPRTGRRRPYVVAGPRRGPRSPILWVGCASSRIGGSLTRQGYCVSVTVPSSGDPLRLRWPRMSVVALFALLGLLAMHATPGMPVSGQHVMSAMSAAQTPEPTGVSSHGGVRVGTTQSAASIGDQRRVPPSQSPHHMLQPCMSDTARHAATDTAQSQGDAVTTALDGHVLRPQRLVAAPARGPTPTPDLTRLCISRT